MMGHGVLLSLVGLFLLWVRGSELVTYPKSGNNRRLTVRVDPDDPTEATQELIVRLVNASTEISKSSTGCRNFHYSTCREDFFKGTFTKYIDAADPTAQTAVFVYQFCLPGDEIGSALGLLLTDISCADLAGAHFLMVPNMLYGSNSTSDLSIISYEHSYHHSHFVREHSDLRNMYTRNFLNDFYLFLPHVIIHKEALTIPLARNEVGRL